MEAAQGTASDEALTRDALLMKLGAARQQAPAWRLVGSSSVPRRPSRGQRADFHAAGSAQEEASAGAPARRAVICCAATCRGTIRPSSGNFTSQLVQVEQAFKHLKGDLGLRPIYHQKEARIEAHIFIAFLAYCLHVTLRRRLRDLRRA